MSTHADDIFPHTTVVFSAGLEGQIKRLKPDHHYVLLEADCPGLMNTTLEDHPDSRHVAIISGTSKVERLIEEQSHNAYASSSI